MAPVAVVPSPDPSAAADAESLREAVQGWGTVETALIDVLGRRTAAQRAEIRRAYAGLYRESLLDSLRSELSLSGDFRNAMVLWTMDPAERDARLANRALGIGNRRMADHHHACWALVEVACASAPDHLIVVRRAYRSLFGCSLEEELAACPALQDPLRKVVPLRSGTERVDEDVARLEAAQLAEAIRKRRQPHGDEVARIVSTRSKHQLRATFQRYKQEHATDVDEVPGHPAIATSLVAALLRQDITKHSSSQFAKILRSAVWCLMSPEKHFAEVIRYSILGFGTDEDTLTRAIISGSEIGMNKIKEEYKVRFKTTVTSDVVGDTSGYYKDFLLTLVGSED